MNILHIDERRGWRGGEQQASYLIRGLAKLGHQNILVGRRGSAFLERGHGTENLVRVALPLRGELDLWSAARLACIVRSTAVDILHAHTSHAHTLACLARAIARRGTVLVSRRVDFRPRSTWLNRLKYRLPDQYVAISDRIAEVMREFGIPGHKLATVHSGIDPARFDVDPLPRAALGVPDGAPLLGNVAALVDHKDQTTLVAAMPRVLEAVPEAHLVIVGEGPLRPQLEQQLTGAGLGNRVHLLGYRNDVPRVLRTLDVFVLSSKEEGLGTSVLDAMAAGIPVVATDGGGIPEMVKNEQTGLLVPRRNPEALAAALVRMLEDGELAQSLVRQAHAMLIERFTHDRMVEGNVQVYEGLLAKRHPG